MDPNKALTEARRLWRQADHLWVVAADAEEDGGPEHRVAELREQAWEVYRECADQYEALDEWISRGGFLPTLWK